MQENFQRPLATLKAKAPRLSRCGAYALLAWRDSNTRHPQGEWAGREKASDQPLRRADTSGSSPKIVLNLLNYSQV